MNKICFMFRIPLLMHLCMLRLLITLSENKHQIT